VNKNSFFYRRKLGYNISYNILRSHVVGESIQQIYDGLSVSANTISQLARDSITLIASDFEKYFQGYQLGSNPDCHHIEIDESKFGKRKYNRGHWVEGVWVFGMVECLTTGEVISYTTRDGTHHQGPKYKAGRFFLCTVPDRTAVTLIPIIKRFCSPESTIRSDFWKAYSSLHPPDVTHDGGATFVDNAHLYDPEVHGCRQHQVVNHAKHLATYDHVRGNHTPGVINTNTIEGLWGWVKSAIPARHRNKSDCLRALLEFMWRKMSGDNMVENLDRALGEVAFPDSVDSDEESTTGPFLLDLVTEQPSGLSLAEQHRRNRQQQERMARWVERQRERSERRAALGRLGDQRSGNA
jgi:hypothetical protein